MPHIYPEDFPGVSIKLSAWATFVDRGWFDVRTKTIYLPKNASLGYAQHEYGHYLQSLSFDPKQYRAIERASISNAFKNMFGKGENHGSLWTERDANRRAGEFFGDAAPINRKLNDRYAWPR